MVKGWARSHAILMAKGWARSQVRSNDTYGEGLG